MCGICGFVSSRNRYSKRQLESMCDELAHRGPDGSGIFLANAGFPPLLTNPSEGNVGLGHRRLSIIDLSAAGAQPMSNEDGSVWVSFNGEIYNFEQLRSELGKSHDFVSATDTEVLVHGYEEWGTDLFEKINGMFAIALWDSRLERMVLARDRLGIKPLYFSVSRGDFIFGSEIHALRKHPSFDPEIDNRALAFYFKLGYIPAPMSVFSSVEKVLPGHYVIYRRGELSRFQYWEVPSLRDGFDFERERFCGSYDEALDHLEELLADSVRMRMISDVPLGAFLSGGIDSSLVVSSMCRVGQEKVRTFSVGFSDERFNECPYARAVAEYLGTDHTEFILGSGDAREMIFSAAANLDEPFGDPSIVPTWLVSHLTRESGVTVALSGDGGDELFCGYQRYSTMAKILKFDAVPPFVRRGVFGAAEKILPERLSRIAGTMRYGYYADAYLARMSGWKNGDADILPGAADPGLYRDSLFYEVAKKAAGLKPIERLMLIDMKTYMVDDVLTKVDRMSMAVSLEVRVPLLDHRIVEFASTLPLDYKFRHGSLKALLTDLACRNVPRSMLDRPKKGFGIPLEDWLRNDLRSLADKYLDADSLRHCGLLESGKVRRAVNDFRNGASGRSRFIWGLMMFSIWLERNGGTLGEVDDDVFIEDDDLSPSLT